MTHTAEALIRLRDPDAVAARLVEHLAEHGLVFQRRGNALVAELPVGSGSLEVRPGALQVGASAPDRAGLERLCLAIAEHVVEFAEGETPEIGWQGLGQAALLADFRELRVVGVQDIAPRLRRLVLAGEDLARFDTLEDLHVRLYIPPEGERDPQWPRQAADGRLLWPAPERRPARRAYTLRRVDAARGLVEIDFVLHPHGQGESPGARFAGAARPGDRCGITGPGGGGLKPADWHLLLGDETALPAIARLLEAMPRTARGVAVVEVDGAADEIPVDHPPGYTLRWLHRAPAEPGQHSLLPGALAGIAWPEQGSRYVWAACEQEGAVRLREALREAGLEKPEFRVAAYWRRGHEGD